MSERRASFEDRTDPTEFHRLVDLGREPWQAGVTYEWHCHLCDTRTYFSAAGGDLDCQCGDGDHFHIYAMLAGDRLYMGTANGILGPGTYTPKKQ